MHTVRRRIAADPGQVWSAVSDPSTYPRWLVGAQAIREVDDEFPDPGSGFHHQVGASPRATVNDSTTSLDAEPERLLRLKVRARPFFVGVVRFRLVPVDGGTEVAVDERPVGPLRFLAPLLVPLVNARNARSLDKLAELVEDGGPGAGSPPG